MAYFAKVKRELEVVKGVKVRKEKGRIIISKDKRQLDNYGLQFIEYSRSNAEGYIEYWLYRLTHKA